MSKYKWNYILAGLMMFLLGRHLPRLEMSILNIIYGASIGIVVWLIFFILIEVNK